MRNGEGICPIAPSPPVQSPVTLVIAVRPSHAGKAAGFCQTSKLVPNNQGTSGPQPARWK